MYELPAVPDEIEHYIQAASAEAAMEESAMFDAKVSNIARSTVTRYGMEEKLGNLSYEEKPTPFLPTLRGPPPRLYSEETARGIDRAVRAISEAAFARAAVIMAA